MITDLAFISLNNHPLIVIKPNPKYTQIVIDENPNMISDSIIAINGTIKLNHFLFNITPLKRASDATGVKFGGWGTNRNQIDSNINTIIKFCLFFILL